MSETSSPATSLEQDIAIVAEAGADSSYYDDAERWTFIFWQRGSPFRRLFDRLDLTSVAELACGHGRHTEVFVAQAGHVTMIDIFDSNLLACRKRLGENAKVSFLKGDGSSFRPLPDSSVTAVICYDAMVHFSPVMVRAYIQDAARILRPGGMALLHHSNLEAPRDRHYGLNTHARNHMTTALFAGYVAEAGLTIAEQRILPWGGIPDIDALSLLQK
jgi:ubiquinone/menaquinone biosynthesis C-methylase UbiE